MKPGSSSRFRTTSACIVGDLADEHVGAVVAALADRGVTPLVFDVALLERSDYRLDHLGLEIQVAGERVRLERGRGWIRRFAPPAWRDEDAPRSYAGVVRAAWFSLLTAALTTLDVAWITQLERLSLAEQKLLQAKVARSLGIETPETYVVSDAGRLPARLGGSVVVKPLGPGSFIDDDGATRVVYTHLLSRTDERLAQLGAAPFLVQENVEAEKHLRVATVGERAWVCQLEGSTEFDWRRDEAAHDSFASTDEFEDVALQALAIVRELSVGYSSQDWIVQGGRRVFIDLNPAGQWLFLPASVAEEVTGAIADWLAAV
jgi:hypothetical protein